MPNKRSYIYLLPLILTVAIHVMAVSIIQLVNSKTSDKSDQFAQDKMIQIENFDKNQLEQLRTKGIKDSQDRSFSEAIYIPPPVNKLSLNDLGLKHTESTSKPEKADSYSTYQKEPVSIKSNSVNLKSEITKNLAVSPSEKYFLDNADFQFSFTPPAGVSEDELNAQEKKFYSFQRRSYQTYVSSFLQTYNNVKRQKPYIIKKLTYANYTIRASVQFDQDGNIVSIKILNPDGDNDVTDLFRQTIENIVALKNPPKEILDNQGFQVYFSLVFSN